MYVQTEPMLLFRRTNTNCYINIIEHAPALVITSTCTFLYYNEITVHATLVMTPQYFYLLNIFDHLKITCGKYSSKTIRNSHSVSIIKRTDVCDCIIQSVEIQLIGCHSNCTSNGNFTIYHTFNFVTEWLHNNKVMPYYRENEHILRFPSSASIPHLPVTSANTTGVYTENKVQVISIQQLDHIISHLQNNKLYLSHSDMIGKDNLLFNESIMDNRVHAEDILDIDSWFDDDTESSMIFVFISCLIALLAFLLLLFLCFKHGQLQRLLSLYMASPPAVNASTLDHSCSSGHVFTYVLVAICILILTFAIIRVIFRCYQFFRQYNTTTHFLCEYGHDKGPSCAIALELGNLEDITHVHIAHLNIPITRLSVRECDHNAYYIVSGNLFYNFLKLSSPIVLLHRNGILPIRTPLTFEIGCLQSIKLRCILSSEYLVSVVAFQNGYMKPLSQVQVYHTSDTIRPARPSTSQQSNPDTVASPSVLYPCLPITSQPTLTSPTTTITSPSCISPHEQPSAPKSPTVIWPN